MLFFDTSLHYCTTAFKHKLGNFSFILEPTTAVKYKNVRISQVPVKAKHSSSHFSSRRIASNTKVRNTSSQWEHKLLILYQPWFFPPHCGIIELNHSQVPAREWRELSRNAVSNQNLLTVSLFESTRADLKHQHTRLLESPSFSTLKNAE